MPYVLVRQTTENFDAWKQVFDECEPLRAAAGCRTTLLLRNTLDPRQLIVLHEFDDVDRAESYVNNPEAETGRYRRAVCGPTGVTLLARPDTPEWSKATTYGPIRSESA